MRGNRLGKKSLELIGKLFEEGAMMLYEFRTAGKEMDMKFNRRLMYNNLYSLERSGYVEIKKNKKNQSFFHLTPKGRLQFLKYLHLEKIKSKTWDGYWRVIIFDIPEDRKKMRERLRSHLKYLGFYRLQHSVYITPYPVMDDLDHILKELGLRKCFRYLTVMELDNDNDLKHAFGLD